MDEIIENRKNYKPAVRTKHRFANLTILMHGTWIFIKSLIQYLPVAIKKLCKFGLKNIEGQLALVTGGANGLGKEIAIKLASVGCNVAIADVNLEDARLTAEEIACKFNVKAMAYHADVSDFNSVQLLKEKIESTLGFVDILVNNAGILTLISLREGTPADIQRIINTNLTSHFWTCRTFLDGMIERKRGHIVAISAGMVLIPSPRTCCYAATKHGIKGLMTSLYLELFADGHDKTVQLTEVYPYFLNTSHVIDIVKDKVHPVVPPQDPSECAEQIVRALRKNQSSVVFPRYMKTTAWLINLFSREFANIFVRNSISHPDFKFSDTDILV